MAQLVKVVKYFDDGTETVHNFVPNSNAAEIEAKVAEAMHEGVVAEAEEVVVEKPKRKKKEVEVKDEE